MDDIQVLSDDLVIYCGDSQLTTEGCFSSGNEVIDAYFMEEAQGDACNVCYVAKNKTNNDTIGLATLCCSGINVGNSECLQLIPAIKLDFFAIDLRYQRKLLADTSPDDPIYVSDLFLAKLVQIARSIAEDQLGARYLVLYAVPEAVHLYDRNGFARFMDFMGAEHHWFIDECTPMYMDL